MSLVGEFVQDDFDSVDPLEPADNMKLSELKSRYGERIALMGGVTREIASMSHEQIDRHIQEIAREAGPYGFILNCGGGIPPEMPLESLMHYLAAIEKYRKISAV
jgi:uroporphyrinogen-III decarboxylase